MGRHQAENLRYLCKKCMFIEAYRVFDLVHTSPSGSVKSSRAVKCLYQAGKLGKSFPQEQCLSLSDIVLPFLSFGSYRKTAFICTYLLNTFWKTIH
jgi:hypothetical protein